MKSRAYFSCKSFEKEMMVDDMMDQVELLAPAGSYDGMRAAYAAGADAVYIGGSRFGARAYAQNPDEENLKRAISYAHEKGKKLYLTVNTLLKDAEMEELYAYLNPYYREGLDAVIVQDIGVLCYIRDIFPGLAIHASTQMGITGAYGAGFLKDLGASRVVTARELSLPEIRAIHEQVDIEIESFVHGALCFCYSGQCLFSSMIGGRSGNRGRCAQPCRLPYDLYDGGHRMNRGEDRYLLSPKDICTLDLLPQIIQSGVCSFKIEGRMKRAEYTAGVTRIYRKYLDAYLQNGAAGYRVLKEDREELRELFDRGGYSGGYYEQRNGRNMMSLQRPNQWEATAGKSVKVTAKKQELLRRLEEQYLLKEYPEKINGKLIFLREKPAILELSCGNNKAVAKGARPEAAKSHPLSAADLEKQMRRTGGSGFSLDHLEIESDDGLFLPVQALNDLRRNALASLRETISARYRREDGFWRAQACPQKGEEPVRTLFSVSVEDAGCLEQLCEVREIDTIYLDCNACLPGDHFLQKSIEWTSICHNAGKRCVYIMPWIFRTDASSYYETREAKEALFLYDGILLRNYEELPFLRGLGYRKDLMTDWNLYTFNAEAQKFWQDEGILYDTVPPELNYRELRKRFFERSEWIVYGYQPLMISAQCQMKNHSGCKKKPGTIWLKDRKQKYFAVKNHCLFCCNVIYNSAPLELLGRADQILRLKPRSVRLQFTTEDAGTILKTVAAYRDAFCRGRQTDRILKDFTKGHFERGVE